MADIRGLGGGRLDEPEIKSARIDHGTSGDNVIVTGVPGKRIAVIGCLVVSTGTVNVIWKDGATDAGRTGDINLQAREGYVLPCAPHPRYWWIGTAGTDLILNLSAAVGVDGIVTYQEID